VLLRALGLYALAFAQRLEFSMAEARSAREGVPKERPYPVDKRALGGKTKSKHNHLINN